MFLKSLFINIYMAIFFDSIPKYTSTIKGIVQNEIHIYIYIYVYVYVFLIFLKNVGNQAITIDCHCMDEKIYILRRF